jgi:plastocyanin
MAPYSCVLRTLTTALAIASFGLIYLPAYASSLTVQVTDAAGQPLVEAAVYAEPAPGQATPKPRRVGEIEQKGRKFLPLVTVVQTGTEISFPNNDSVRHHVYSFSPAKTFELKLYSGIPGSPVAFDKPGTVVVGCNIHDQMVAYIHVVNTPYFAKTDSVGKAKLEGLPAGKYQVKTWHFQLPIGAAIPEQAITLAANDAAASFQLNTKAGRVAN